jgi:hypothetical protein
MEAITGRGSKVWEKLVKLTVGREKTQWPKTESDLENQGVRFDYDGTIEDNSLLIPHAPAWNDVLQDHTVIV